jgi:hypothetical protein
MQCRDNNDYHNNDCGNNSYCICAAFEHREFVRTKILPPFQKNKELLLLFCSNTHVFYKRALGSSVPGKCVLTFAPLNYRRLVQVGIAVSPAPFLIPFYMIAHQVTNSTGGIIIDRVDIL